MKMDLERGNIRKHIYYMIFILFQSLSSALITKQLSWQSFPSLVRWMSAVARPFPVIQDPLDLSCPQLAESRRKAEEQLAQLEQLNKVALGGGEKMPICYMHLNHTFHILLVAGSFTC